MGWPQPKGICRLFLPIWVFDVWAFWPMGLLDPGPCVLSLGLCFYQWNYYLGLKNSIQYLRPLCGWSVSGGLAFGESSCSPVIMINIKWVRDVVIRSVCFYLRIITFLIIVLTKERLSPQANKLITSCKLEADGSYLTIDLIICFVWFATSSTNDRLERFRSCDGHGNAVGLLWSLLVGSRLIKIDGRGFKVDCLLNKNEKLLLKSKSSDLKQTTPN